MRPGPGEAWALRCSHPTPGQFRWGHPAFRECPGVPGSAQLHPGEWKVRKPPSLGGQEPCLRNSTQCMQARDNGPAPHQYTGKAGGAGSPGCRVSQKTGARIEMATGESFLERVRCEPCIQASVDLGNRKAPSMLPALQGRPHTSGRAPGSQAPAEAWLAHAAQDPNG